MIVNGIQRRSVWHEKKTIKFLDQRKLPFSVEVYTATTVEDVAYAIREMVVRGAPAIGAAAAYGMALGAAQPQKSAQLLCSTRPTAHDLFYAVESMLTEIERGTNVFDAASAYVEDIVARCRQIGLHGATLIKKNMTILTHCNAGALATVDYGTALAPLRIAHQQGKQLFVYADETRPRLQGILTAWELHQEGIPHAVIADNAAGYFMRNNQVNLVIVGADRIAQNGDVANKIGTYEKAVLAKDNGIPFYVAAPVSTFDPTITTGTEIVIEERHCEELTTCAGHVIMPDWVSVKNPAFDVTPASYITGYITEEGIRSQP
ncbi:MAG: S-methyl-5-thioribose-1-phosphate isomerase [Candidatus Thermoplasmatota archaeon]|nr:S-methyl-5-thioribose-1-phosphate isomerase [Candidatus Thermoplasmatota archaeon]